MKTESSNYRFRIHWFTNISINSTKGINVHGVDINQKL